MPPIPCNRNDFLWPSTLELKYSFNLCKYLSLPVKNVLECFRGARGGKVVSGGVRLRLMLLVIYELGLLLCYQWTIKHNNLCKLSIFHKDVVCPRKKIACSLLRVVHPASYCDSAAS